MGLRRVGHRSRSFSCVSAPLVVFVSFRLGGPDGVSIEAAKWKWAFEELGMRVLTVAGGGPVDVLVAGLGLDAQEGPDPSELRDITDSADLVVVENLCSLPLNPRAASVVADALRGRPAVMHHHDLPWQRPRFATEPTPPDDAAWAHVVINDSSRRELEARGIRSTLMRNTFDPETKPGEREATRTALGIGGGELLVLQPTRALPRKNVAGGLALAEALGATYWLLGDAEDGYGPELERLLDSATTPVRHGYGKDGAGSDVADAYAASDVVVLPSTWEGFGNPAVESALHRRPLAIGRYPVARELAAFGFRWFDAEGSAAISRWLSSSDRRLLDHNREVATTHFSMRGLPGQIASLLRRSGWARLLA